MRSYLKRLDSFRLGEKVHAIFRNQSAFRRQRGWPRVTGRQDPTFGFEQQPDVDIASDNLVIFRDDFTTPGRWLTRDDRLGSWGYIDNQYRIAARSGCYCFSLAPSPAFSGNKRVEVDSISSTPGMSFVVQCAGAGTIAHYLGLIVRIPAIPYIPSGVFVHGRASKRSSPRSSQASSGSGDSGGDHMETSLPGRPYPVMASEEAPAR